MRVVLVKIKMKRNEGMKFWCMIEGGGNNYDRSMFEACSEINGESNFLGFDFFN